MQEKLLYLTNKLNIIINTNKYSIPLLDNFEVIRKDIKSNIVFVAKNNNTVYSFLSDGILNKNELLEDRINKIVNNSNVYTNNNNGSSYQIYYKDYNINDFNFKIYLQDIYINRKNDILTLRSINAYFVDENKYVYLISLTSGPYLLSDNNKLKNIKDISNDKVFSSLEKGMMIILNGVRYNKNMDNFN